MKERSKKVDDYLKNRKKVQRERFSYYEKKEKKKEKKNYAYDEFPERETLKKAGKGFLNLSKKTFEKLKKRLLKAKAQKNKSDGQNLLNNKEKFAGRINNIIIFLIHLTVFAFPIINISVIASVNEHPKQIFLLLTTGIAALLWVVKLLILNNIRIRKSFLFIPLTLFVAAYTLSTIFSISPYNSFWGSSSQESLSLISLLSYVLFFVVFSNVISFKSLRRTINTLLFSGFIVSLLSMIHLWQGIPFGILKDDKLNFLAINSIGTSSQTILFIQSLAILAAGLSVYAKRKANLLLYILISVGYLFFLSSIFDRNLWIFFILAAGSVLASAITRKRMGSSGYIILPIAIFMFALFTFLINKPIFNRTRSVDEVALNSKNSVYIFLKAVKQHPLLGSGPDTFIYNFELFKPKLSLFVQAVPNKNVSYLAALAMTTGLLTFTAYIFLIFILLRFTVATALTAFFGGSRKADTTLMAISIFWIYLTFAGFFYSLNITLIFLWWLALAMIDINRPVKSFFSIKFSNNNLAKKDSLDSYQQIKFAKINLIISLALIIYITVFISLIYLSAQRIIAAYYYKRAMAKNVQEQKLAEISSDLEKALKFDEKNVVYLRNSAVVYFTLARERINKINGRLSGEDSKYISDNLAMSIRNSNLATKYNPNDFENYLNLGWIYREMGSIEKDFGDKSLENYKKALDLSKDNPDLYYQIADLHLKMYNKIAQEEEKQNNSESPKAIEHILHSEENLKKALAINKYHFKANIFLVSVYSLLQKEDQAFEKAQENWELFMGNSTAGYNLAVFYYRKNNCDKTESILEIVLRERPGYANARYLYALCLAKDGNLEESLSNFREIQVYNSQNQTLNKIIEDLEMQSTDFLEQF